MIMFWNRREVFMGYSIKEFSDIREILSLNKIKYDYKLVNYTGGSMGTVGERKGYSTMYYLYVHKKDYENARFILSK